MSTAQHPEFNLQFIKDNISEWSEAANKYHKDAEKAYGRIRSYLTLYQFRLSDQAKCDIREMLTQHLDELDKHDLITDMDNYLDGFCFKLDKSVLPAINTDKVTINRQTCSPAYIPVQQSQNLNQQQISDQDRQNLNQQMPEVTQCLPQHNQEMFDSYVPVDAFSDNAIDYNDLDFYARQFYQ